MGNFLQFDPAKNNMQTDSVYATSSFRAQGAQTGIASSSAFNKLIYQLSTMTTALADMMIAKGYAIDDASLATLTKQLDNIMTLADMSAYASTASLLDYIKKEAVVIKTTSYIVLTTDMYKTLEANSSGTLTFTLPAYATVANGAWIKIKNIGSGTLTLSGLIDGAATTYLNQYEEITVYNDGESWRGKVIADLNITPNNLSTVYFKSDYSASGATMTTTLTETLSAGNWLVFAWYRAYTDPWFACTMLINGVQVDDFPAFGDTEGAGLISSFGCTKLILTTPTAATATVNHSGLAKRLMIVAIKTES